MDLIYRFYVLLCISQTAGFLLIISQGIHFLGVDLIDAAPPIPYPFKIDPKPNNLNNISNFMYNYYSRTVFNNNTESLYPAIVLVSEMTYLDKEVFTCSILAVLFSVLYIHISNLDHQTPFLEKYGDDEYAMDVRIENGRALEVIRFIFWAFVFMQYLIVFSSMSLPIKTEEKYLYAILKTIIVWFLCRTGKGKHSGILFLLTIGGYLYMLWIFAISFSRQDISYKKRLLIFTFETILDAILVLGHYWDERAPMLTVLNCRLFYTAMACTLSQLTAFIPVIE
jgi:hypothetical protein